MFVETHNVHCIVALNLKTIHVMKWFPDKSALVSLGGD